MAKFFNDSLTRHLEEVRGIMRPIEEMQQWNERFKELSGASRLGEEFAQVRHSSALDEVQKLSSASVLGIAAQGAALPAALRSIGAVDPGLKVSLASSLALEQAVLKIPFLDFREEIEDSARHWHDQLKALDLHSLSRQIQEMLAASQTAADVFEITSPIDRYADTLHDGV